MRREHLFLPSASMCTLGAQSRSMGREEFTREVGKGTDRAGCRTQRAYLFQGLQEPGAGDRTDDRYRGSYARIEQNSGAIGFLHCPFHLPMQHRLWDRAAAGVLFDVSIRVARGPNRDARPMRLN